MAEEEKKTIGKVITNFLEKSRFFLLGIVIALIAVAVVFGIVIEVRNSNNEKAYTFIDEVSFSLVQNRKDLTGDELTTYEKDTITKLLEFSNNKKGSAYSRASLLAADIAFEQKNYVDAKKYYLEAQEKNPKAYTSAICFYNVAICSEELDQSKEAIEFFQKAIAEPDFPLTAHAYLNIGRIYESMNDYSSAITNYQLLCDNYSDDSWADLAKSRLIILNTEGKQ